MNTQLGKQYAHSALVIPVPNILNTLAFYEDKLGFEVTFRWGDPLEYVVGRLGSEIRIHFTQAEGISSYAISLYVFVHNVNFVHEKLKKNEVQFLNEISDRDYGMRDFDIADLNGLRLTFGTGLDLISAQ